MKVALQRPIDIALLNARAFRIFRRVYVKAAL
jgi:hypothetical protein